MNNSNINVIVPELMPFINQIVGYVKVNKKYVNHNNSFECAAWWEDSEIQTGVYPLILGKAYHTPKNLKLFTKLDAIVVDDYFPALWAGVSVSDKPYTPKNIGEKRIINSGFDIVECIDRTGHIPNSDNMDFFVNPMIYDLVIASAQESMNNYHSLLAKYWENYQKEPFDKYQTNLGMVAHCSENIASLSRDIQKIVRHKEYFQNNSSEYYNNLRNNNTLWVLDSRNAA